MSEKEINTLKGPEVSRGLYGGVLDSDGAGFYPGLELINLIFSCGSDMLPKTGRVKLLRRAHDFTRKLVWDDSFSSHPRRRETLLDDESEEALRQMFECLQLPIPGLRKTPTWERAHFFPYTKSLIHWDARDRGKKLNIERRYFRGGGAMAFHVLRVDPDARRHADIVKGFENLYPERGTPLERVAAELAQNGHSDSSPGEDQLESKTVIWNDILEDLYRDGIRRVLSHGNLSVVSRIRAVINWTAFWLINTETKRSADKIGEPEKHLICDCGGTSPQLRRASQRCLIENQSLIESAVEAFVEESGGSLPKKQLNSMKGFYTSTAATIGLLNARTGRRHFAPSLDLVETLVLAGIEKDDENTFDEFLYEWLYQKCGLIIGRRAAEETGAIASLDAGIFEDNEEALAAQMAAQGLLTTYSDATRMVNTIGLQ